VIAGACTTKPVADDSAAGFLLRAAP